MTRVAWRMLTQHPMRAVATFVALLYGAAVLAVCGVLLESALRYHGVPQSYGASAVVLAAMDLTIAQGSGDNLSVNSYPLPEGGRVDADLARRIAALPGVRRVVPDVTVPAQLTARTPGGTNGNATTAWTASGHPWSAAALAPFTLQAGVPPTSAGDVVLDAALARATGTRPGQAVRLVVPDGVHTFTVTGTARGPATGEPVVFFADARAEALAGHPGTANVLGVIAGRGVNLQTLAAAIRATLPAHPAAAGGVFPQVYAGADRGLAGSPDAENGKVFIIAVSASFGGWAFLIAILVISGTVGLSVQQRHRDIALLRAIAATRSQVRRMLLIEAVVLGAVAGAAGVWAGLASARWLRSQFVSQGFVPGSFALRVSWLPPIVAVCGVLIVAVAAAWIAGLRASRIRPVEALREATVERRGRLADVVRALLGLAALAGGIALAGVAAHLTASAAAGTAIGLVATLVIAVALLAPWLTRIVVAICAAGLRRLGVPGRLAAANLAASARRLSPVVSSLVLAVALGGSLWFLQTSIQHAAAQQSRAGLVADQVITTAGAGLPAGVAQAARHVPGVAAAGGIVCSTMLSDQGDEYTAEGADASTLPATIDLGTVSGRLSALRGYTVAVDTVTASDLNLRVGSTFHGWFGDGAPATLRVVAVYRRGLGFANLTLPSDMLRPHTATGLDSLVVVADSPGSDHSSVLAALARAIQGSDPGAQVATPSDYQTAVNAQIAQNTWTIHVSVIVLLVYVIIAALNTLAMAALARRGELAILRLAGVTRRQLLRMVRIEQAVLLGLALTVGGGIAALTLVPMVKGTTGSATPYIPTGGWVAVIGGTILLGMAGTLLPILRMLQIPPSTSSDHMSKPEPRRAASYSAAGMLPGRRPQHPVPV
jgi:putative ABC transport system permease protein